MRNIIYHRIPCHRNRVLMHVTKRDAPHEKRSRVWQPKSPENPSTPQPWLELSDWRTSHAWVALADAAGACGWSGVTSLDWGEAAAHTDHPACYVLRLHTVTGICNASYFVQIYETSVNWRPFIVVWQRTRNITKLTSPKVMSGVLHIWKAGRIRSLGRSTQKFKHFKC